MPAGGVLERREPLHARGGDVTEGMGTLWTGCSASERKPLALISDWWTKISSLPSSGVMKPKPFWALNHFTVPVAAMIKPAEG